MLKIHYRNRHGGTNLPWQAAFKKYGELSLGSIETGNFPEEIDHLHLGGSCKGKFSSCKKPITVEEIKEVQERTGCAISVFFGDPVPQRFKFHHELLDNVSKVKVYSAALFGTSMWRPDVSWVLHPVDDSVFKKVGHEKNDTVLFVGEVTPFRREVLMKLLRKGIKVDAVGKGGNIDPAFGAELVELSKGYSISIGIAYDEDRPKLRYSSSRLPCALAMGLIYIESDFDLRGVFDSDELIQWATVDDLAQKIYYFREHLEEGRRIMAKSRKKVLNNWTNVKLAQKFVEEGDH